MTNDYLLNRPNAVIFLNDQFVIFEFLGPAGPTPVCKVESMVGKVDILPSTVSESPSKSTGDEISSHSAKDVMDSITAVKTAS
ncbi:hypothetical protein CEXT_653881 [Caerostris extrusa]|uniref:Uncharacterized protein n=1 Tax=Caerostris extrusa TaxID=172846 RepID=A0AAV4T040_CAEEX|nr:hypothetical protein CEXT_653881 [Caerostris extrusa]